MFGIFSVFLESKNWRQVSVCQWSEGSFLRAVQVIHLSSYVCKNVTQYILTA